VSRELGAGLHPELREVLEPLLKEIESLNERIKEYEVRMEKIARESYPQVERLKQSMSGFSKYLHEALAIVQVRMAARTVTPNPGQSSMCGKSRKKIQ